MSKKKFTFEEHEQLGEELFTTSKKLLDLSHTLNNAYGRKLSCLSDKAYAAVEELRNQLDNRVFEENRELTTNKLADVYYCAYRLSPKDSDEEERFRRSRERE